MKRGMKEEQKRNRNKVGILFVAKEDFLSEYSEVCSSRCTKRQRDSEGK